MNLELEAFKNFSKFFAILLLLLAFSAVTVHNFKKKEKENKYLVQKIIQK